MNFDRFYEAWDHFVAWYWQHHLIIILTWAGLFALLLILGTKGIR